MAVVQVSRRRFNFFQSRQFWPWLLFLFINAFLSFFSFDQSSSLINFFRLLSFFSAFIFGYLTFDTAKKLTRLAKVVIFSAIIPAVVAWWQLANGTGFYDGTRWRLDGTFTHPNMLALYLVLAISLALFVSLNLRRGALGRVVYGLLAGFFVIPLIFTYTRIAWLALAFILLAVGIYRFRKLLFISIAVVVLAFFLWPSFQSRVLSLASLSAVDSSSWRLNLWQNIISYIKVKPWFGYGPGTAAVFLKDNVPQLLTETEPHNDYLRIWLESGIFALLSYLWIFVDYLKRLWRGFKAETRPRLKMLLLFSGLFSLAILGASLTDNVIKDAVMQWEFWTIAGGLLAVIRLLPNKKKD
jgi:O-antigen ligase